MKLCHGQNRDQYVARKSLAFFLLSSLASFRSRLLRRSSTALLRPGSLPLPSLSKGQSSSFFSVLPGSPNLYGPMPHKGPSLPTDKARENFAWYQKSQVWFIVSNSGLLYKKARTAHPVAHFGVNNKKFIAGLPSDHHNSCTLISRFIDANCACTWKGGKVRKGDTAVTQAVRTLPASKEGIIWARG